MGEVVVVQRKSELVEQEHLKLSKLTKSEELVLKMEVGVGVAQSWCWQVVLVEVVGEEQR